MFFNKIKLAGIFSIVPAAKPTTTTLAFHFTHFKLGTIRPCGGVGAQGLSSARLRSRGFSR